VNAFKYQNRVDTLVYIGNGMGTGNSCGLMSQPAVSMGLGCFLVPSSDKDEPELELIQGANFSFTKYSQCLTLHQPSVLRGRQYFS